MTLQPAWCGWPATMAGQQHSDRMTWQPTQPCRATPAGAAWGIQSLTKPTHKCISLDDSSQKLIMDENMKLMKTN